MIATLGAWLHDLSPMAIPIAGSFGLRWYALSYLAGFVLGGLLLHRLAKRGLWLVPADRVLDAVVLLGVSVIVGGRLGYILLYQPSLLWTITDSFPFWGAIMLNRGGMASHGGMLGVIFAAWRISKGFKDEDGTIRGACPTLHVLDGLVLVAPIGLLFGRLANFVNGELLGRVVAPPGEPAPWWAVRFPQEHLTTHAPRLDPAQERALSSLVLEHALPSDPPDEWFVLGYERALAKLQSGGAEVSASIAERLEPLVSARHPSQLYQAFTEGLVTLAVVWFIARKPRRPGVIGAWFLISYGLGRIATEFWRLPDDHFSGSGVLNAARPLGLSRGQWLSAAMVVFGVGLLVWVARRGGERLMGWTRPSHAASSDA